jgi:uncharacterized protein (DUF433 family)
VARPGPLPFETPACGRLLRVTVYKVIAKARPHYFPVARPGATGTRIAKCRAERYAAEREPKRSKSMPDHPRIALAPDILAGKPVIRGTRLSVEFIIGLLADRWAQHDILSNYQGITHDDIIACFAYARDTLSSEI